MSRSKEMNSEHLPTSENRNKETFDEMLDDPKPPSAFSYTLRKPVEVKGEKITEIEVDFDTLDSYSMDRIAKKFPEIATFQEMSKSYLIEIVAAAANLNPHVIKSMCIADGTALTMAAQTFLLSANAGIKKKL